MSVFVPPSPTGAVAAVDGVSNLGGSANTNSPSGNNANSNTDPFTQSSPGSSNANSNTNANNSNSNTGNGDGDGDESSSEEGIHSPTADLPLATKIGVGVGIGAGSIILVVLVTWVLWKRRMGSRRSYRSGDDSDSMMERGMSPTPQEKAKMDFESEHDVAFDFGSFFRERGGRRVVNDNVGGGGENLKEVRAVEMGDRLPAFEAPSQAQGGNGQQQVVAELDGGGVPEYRGVIGVGR